MTLKRPMFYLVAGLLCGVFASAQAQDIKIGFVNPVKVMETAPQVEAANKRLEQEFAPKEQRIVEMQKELRQMEERLGKDEAIMSEKNLNDLRRDIMAKKRDLKRDQDEFREEYNFRRSEELDKLQKQIYKAIETLAKDMGYDLVVSDGVIVASERVDITDMVLKRLQEMQ